MDQSKISRNYNCNIHTDQKVISVCLEPACYRPVLCLECIKDTDIHPLQHNKIISLQNFFGKVEADSKKKSAPKNKHAIMDIRETAYKYQTSLKTVKENIELEKKMVEESINELITAFAIKMHSLKQEVCQKLDAQVDVFGKNFKNFSKLAQRLPVDDDHEDPFTAIYEAFNKAGTYNQLEELIKQHKQEVSAPNKGAVNKGEDEHIFKLKTAAQTLRENTKYPSTTVLTNANLEGVKQKLAEDVNKFFANYLKFQKEFAPMELNTLQCDSKILKDAKSFTLLSTFLKGDYKIPALDLIYRGSRDGFTAGSFHAKCDKKGPTLMLVNSTKDKTFGAYTDVEWATDEQYKSSNKAFLFSIDHREKYPLKAGHTQYAIKGSKTLGPCFGGGHDLRLSANFIHEECSGYVGFSYDAKDKYSKDIYGDNAFYVKEIEIYRVSEEQDFEEEPNDIIMQKKKSEKVPVDDWAPILPREEEKNDNDNNIKETMSKLASIDDMETIVDWISPKRNFTLELLYRASRDGYSSENFHKKCDNKSPTLTLIKSKKAEQVFGGYTKQPWNKSNMPAACKDTFVFSVTKKQKFEILDDENAIFRSSVAGPVFGNGDIFICSDCNKKAESYSNLGVGFEAQNMDDSAVFFADEQFFLVDNVEVFQVKFIA